MSSMGAFMTWWKETILCSGSSKLKLTVTFKVNLNHGWIMNISLIWSLKTVDIRQWFVATSQDDVVISPLSLNLHNSQ